MMTKKEIWERFQQEDAQKYSTRSRIYIMGWKQLYSISVEYLKSIFGKSNFQALDLGAGTGYFTKWLLKELEGAYVSVTDFSKNMLSAVERSLNEFNGRYETFLLDFQEDQIGIEKYDLIVSSMAIHHLQRIEDYRRLYRKIYTALKIRGIFLCIDVLKGADLALDIFYRDFWLDHLTECYGQKAAKRIIDETNREDSPLSLYAHLRLLHECGFNSSDCLWKHNNFGSYVARKSDNLL
ncbi:MAG: class I SAM-dependent methyltransferase [Candidatus Hodarchaeota archaeon]